ncbi:MAG: ORF6N domain-containing protein [Myxococcales bacterium]
MGSDRNVLSLARVESAILSVRGVRVMLDADLAALYRVETKALVRAVKRNAARFPRDFMFVLSPSEFESLRFQFGTSSSWGGRRYPPYAFTEQGVAMRSGVLRSSRAIQVNIEIMRAFVRPDGKVPLSPARGEGRGEGSSRPFAAAPPVPGRLRSHPRADGAAREASEANRLQTAVRRAPAGHASLLGRDDAPRSVRELRR